MTPQLPYADQQAREGQTTQGGGLVVDRTSSPQGTWFLPVAGMSNSPSQFDGNAPAWATGSFGYQKPASKGGHTHKGTDIYAQAGAAIVAPVAGHISSAGFNNTSGHFVKLKGVDGIEYFFAHMGQPSGLTQGARVSMGNQIGEVGNTGNASGTSAHLHFEMRKGGKSINPNAWLESGRQQEFSTIAGGLKSPDELMAWAMEEREAMGLDMSAVQQRAQRDKQVGISAPQDRNAIGTSMLGGMFESLSRQQAGGSRVPVPRIPGQGAQAPSGESDIQAKTPVEMRTVDTDAAG